ncbi:MAG TPA: hypothetical protein VJY39_06335 [Acidisphaera sp.]|nr:hypothetical protein [Acidisphaera sp.]
MAEEPFNLVLDLLRAIRADVSALRDDMRDLRMQVSDLQISVAALRRDKLTMLG